MPVTAWEMPGGMGDLWAHVMAPGVRLINIGWAMPRAGQAALVGPSAYGACRRWALPTAVPGRPPAAAAPESGCTSRLSCCPAQPAGRCNGLPYEWRPGA